jgi:ClpP class serine protease
MGCPSAELRADDVDESLAERRVLLHDRVALLVHNHVFDGSQAVVYVAVSELGDPLVDLTETPLPIANSLKTGRRLG